MFTHDYIEEGAVHELLFIRNTAYLDPAPKVNAIVLAQDSEEKLLGYLQQRALERAQSPKDGDKSLVN